jgi:hypothetical protein
MKSLQLLRRTLLMPVMAASSVIAQPVERIDPDRSVEIAIVGRVFDRCGGNGLAAAVVLISHLTGDTLATAGSELLEGG